LKKEISKKTCSIRVKQGAWRVYPFTQGDALGYGNIGLSARHCTYVISFTSLHIRCWYRVLANVIGFHVLANP
ncbi:hypothetical protein, partial [uncultured Prevotella sp.]|uniref:hypothetical protein n=1 Tax=uncultured Prevotella sp. TaxID=159272 RepID=UPI002666626D